MFGSVPYWDNNCSAPCSLTSVDTSLVGSSKSPKTLAPTGQTSTQKGCSPRRSVLRRGCISPSPPWDAQAQKPIGSRCVIGFPVSDHKIRDAVAGPPVKNAHAIRAGCETVSASDTTVIIDENHAVLPTKRSTDRANLLARCVVAMLAGDG